MCVQCSPHTHPSSFAVRVEAEGSIQRGRSRRERLDSGIQVKSDDTRPNPLNPQHSRQTVFDGLHRDVSALLGRDPVNAVGMQGWLSEIHGGSIHSNPGLAYALSCRLTGWQTALAKSASGSVSAAQIRTPYKGWQRIRSACSWLPLRS